MIKDIDILNLTNVEGGKLTATLFTGGCNLRCPYCYNTSLVYNEGEDLTDRDIFKVLDKRFNMLDGICITGGEPMIHGNTVANKDSLAKLCSLIKTRYGEDFFIKLDTNGTLPHHWNEEMVRNIDYVAIDLKSPANYCKFSKDCDSITAKLEVSKAIKEMREHMKLIQQTATILDFRQIPFEFRMTMFTREILESERYYDYSIVEKNFYDEVQKLKTFKADLYLQKFKHTGNILDDDKNSPIVEPTNRMIFKHKIELEPFFNRVIERY